MTRVETLEWAEERGVRPPLPSLVGVFSFFLYTRVRPSRHGISAAVTPTHATAASREAPSPSRLGSGALRESKPPTRGTCRQAARS